MKKAFTFAETLITIGIIGVVAAMTMPVIVQNYRAKVLETAFKKSTSALYQAFELTKQELGTDDIYQYYAVYDEMANTYLNAHEFEAVFEKNLKVVSQYKSSFYPIYNYNKSKFITANIGYDYPNATKILADGSSYGIWTNSDTNRIAIHVYIDTNGPYKKPNQYGHDIFQFQIRKDNKLTPVKMTKSYSEGDYESGSPEMELKGYPCSTKNKQASNGAGCAYYALNNINPDDNTKKYWQNLP